MKRAFFLPLVLLGLLAAAAEFARAAEPSEESKLIEILKSSQATLGEKNLACARLKFIGTSRSVDALASLLTDSQLSHSARYALESMPAAEAQNALTRALSRTSGLLQAGIINSLGVRGETGAVPQLAKWLCGSDESVAVASAEALGRIGGKKALAALQKAASTSTGNIHKARVDGILRCGYHLLETGKRSDALKVFEHLYAGEKADRFRVAAFRGMIMASGKAGITRMADAITGSDGVSQSAALQAASQLEGADVTRALASLLPRLNAPVQIALIDCLARRGDTSAPAAVARSARMRA
jgi:HEAT repeat protein